MLIVASWSGSSGRGFIDRSGIRANVAPGNRWSSLNRAAVRQQRDETTTSKTGERDDEKLYRHPFRGFRGSIRSGTCCRSAAEGLLLLWTGPDDCRCRQSRLATVEAGGIAAGH